MRRFPALVAAVTGDDGHFLGVQRTWLDPRRPAKAGVATPRKALGRIHGLAVRFGAPSDDAPLVVGEGIETVLSLVTAVPEITAAAALSAGSLGAFAPPPGLARLVIARDNDEDGALAAERLARRCARAGIAATVIVPAGNDFNDDLVDIGPAALRARFAPLFRARALRLAGRSGPPVRWRKRRAEGRASRPEERGRRSWPSVTSSAPSMRTGSISSTNPPASTTAAPPGPRPNGADRRRSRSEDRRLQSR